MGEKLKKTTKNAKKKKEQLTEKEKLFCLVYINNFNAASAVIKAGYNPKDRQRASEIGYQLLQKTPVCNEITRLKKEKAKTLNFDPRNDIVERFMRIAFADMTDFIEWGRVEVPVMNMFGPVMTEDPETGEEIPVTKEVNEIRFKESNNIDGALVCQIKQGKEGASIKLEDRQRALEWLADYFEMNPMNRHKRDYDNKILAQRERELDNKLKDNQGIQDAVSAAKAQIESVFNRLENPAPNRTMEDIGDD